MEAIWEIEQRGLSFVFADALHAIVTDKAWGKGVRVQAAQALAMCSDARTERLLIDLLADPVVGPWMAVRLATHRFSDDGWQRLLVLLDGEARGKVCWVMSRQPYRWNTADIRKIVSAAAGGNCKEAVAALLSYERNRESTVAWLLWKGDASVLRAPSILALIAMARDRHPELRDVLEPLIGSPDSEVRQMAILAYARHLGAAGVPLLEEVFRRGERAGDRVAAVLGMMACGVDDEHLERIARDVGPQDADSVRLALLYSLGRRRVTKTTRDFLEPLLHSEEFWVRSEMWSVMSRPLRDEVP